MGLVGIVARKILVPRSIESILEQIPKKVGTYGNAPWGFDREGSKIGFALLKRLYDHCFRVTAHGLEHIPKTGRVPVIANHSGQIPFDGALIGVAMATNPNGPRVPRAMIGRFFPAVPFVGNRLNEAGAVIGNPVNRVRMLLREEAVIVFPEGARGSGTLPDPALRQRIHAYRHQRQHPYRACGRGGLRGNHALPDGYQTPGKTPWASLCSPYCAFPPPRQGRF
jgi:hypothetical protein